ncbi:hypothetical protein CIB48_g704 [Xylaria polymorpha]|nr:hypothetical protein CIB48_g704 [Xylaria polymorpha]
MRITSISCDMEENRGTIDRKKWLVDMGPPLAPTSYPGFPPDLREQAGDSGSFLRIKTLVGAVELERPRSK